MGFDARRASSETVVIHVGEALDFRNADAFKSTFQEHVENGVRQFVLDFSDTEVLDSTGLGAIFSLYRRSQEQIGGPHFRHAPETLI